MSKFYPLKIVLTGGIASGKSTVANLFAELGIPIIDADQISHELVQPGSVILDKIIEYFGKEYLDSKDHLDRSKLRERIFYSKPDRLWLENLLHPEIYKIIQEKIQSYLENPIPYIICVIPLYFEAKKPDDIVFDQIIVIDVPEKLQISRLMARDHIDQLQAENILKSQVSRQTRLTHADKIITNTSDIDFLKTQILKIDQRYRASYN